MRRGVPIAWKRRILVVANKTATSEELISALEERSLEEPTEFTLLCPANRRAEGGAAAARANLEEASTRMRERGLELAGGRVGAPDPFEAVLQVYDPREFDEVIVSTLPASYSRWLALDAPRRIQRHTGASVTHLEGAMSKTFC